MLSLVYYYISKARPVLSLKFTIEKINKIATKYEKK